MSERDYDTLKVFDGGKGYSSLQVYAEAGDQPGIIIGAVDGAGDFYAVTPQTARDLATHLIALVDKLEGKS